MEENKNKPLPFLALCPVHVEHGHICSNHFTTEIEAILIMYNLTQSIQNIVIPT
jgi:hypothetical protein